VRSRSTRGAARRAGLLDRRTAGKRADSPTRLASDGSVRICDPGTGELVLVAHGLARHDYASLAGGRVVSCSAGAWRWLGWLAPPPVTGQPTRYPAEVFGPLSVRAPAGEPPVA
jgi:hypothetical protein